MEKHIIRDSRRKIIMDQKSIFGNDICEQLAEIITNSDDSYNRIEENNNYQQPKKIEIYINRQESEFIIVDHAEGMTKKELITNFEEYDADTSGSDETNNVRGMFGRGATDVLLESARIGKDNYIISIKDNTATQLIFNFDEIAGERFFIENELTHNQLKEIRIKYQIEKNGTIVKFGTDRKIPLDISDRLPDYYMLQFIFSSNKRDITILDENRTIKPKKDMSYFYQCEKLINQQLKIEYKDFILDANLQIIHNKNKTNKHGILIYDEKHAVYDDTFFGRERDAGMGEIEGRLEINGLTNMLKSLLTTNSERIVTPTRDGFDTRHPFYIELKNKVEGYLIAACSKVTSNNKNNTVSLRNNKEWKKFFKEINQYFKEELDEITDGGPVGIETPPEEGIIFKKQSIEVKKEKFYGITLIINPYLIKPGSVINLEYDNQYIEISSKRIIVPEPKNSISSVLIGITGKELTDNQKILQATTEDYIAKLFYEVKNEEIHIPAYGMDFYPETLTKKPEVERFANIYVDIEKFPINTEIKIINENEEIHIPFESIKVEESNLVSSNIAKIEIPISGGKVNTSYSISALAKNRNITLDIKVRITEENESGRFGTINDIQPRKSSVNYVQSYFMKEEKIIVIVSNNIINSMLLEKWLKSDGTRFESNSEKYYFYSIVAEELARIMLNEKKEKDKIQLSSNAEELINILSEEKDKMYKKILSCMENKNDRG